MASKMIDCKTCGNPIAKSAKVCPSCGAKNKPPMGTRIAVVAAVLVVFAVIGLLFGEEPPKSVDGGGTTRTVSSTTAPAKTAFGVGEAAELNGIVVTLVDVSESNGSQYNKPTDGNTFLICELEIENGSSSDLAISSLISFEAYIDDYSKSLSLSALMASDGEQLDGSIAAGKKMRGVVGYEVPADWKALELRFSPSVWSGKSFTFTASK